MTTSRSQLHSVSTGTAASQIDAYSAPAIKLSSYPSHYHLQLSTLALSPHSLFTSSTSISNSTPITALGSCLSIYSASARFTVIAA